MTYQVIINNKVIKEYPYRIQAVIWCILKRYVYEGDGHRWIIGAEIKEVKDSFGKCDESHFFPSENVKWRKNEKKGR